ncbi:MAG: BACON domain-containing protein [Bacteroidales bacterium]|nr:BACON domain-containing protein [Bacteroidales bacterium]
MASRIQSFLLVLAAVLPLCACNQEEPEQNGPTYLNVSFSRDNLRADQSTIAVTVECDWAWEATLASTAWSGINDIKQDGKTGSFTIVALFNDTDETRTNTLVVKSGQKSVETSFTQTGLGDYFQPRQLVLSGTQESSISFNASADWEAAIQEGEEWITLKTTSGKAGQSVITCAAKADLYETETRYGVIRLSHSDQYIDIPVVQGQTDLIEVTDGQSLTFGPQSQSIEIKTKYNVAYKVSVSDPSWIQYIETKALLTANELFTLTANESTDSRSGYIKLESQDNPDLSVTVNLVQQGLDPIVQNKTCGLYGLQGQDLMQGEDGWNLLSRATLPNGSSVFRLLNARIPAAAVLTYNPLSLKTGEQCQLHVMVMDKGNVTLEADYDVVQVYEKEGLHWLKKASDDNVYFIIK